MNSNSTLTLLALLAAGTTWSLGQRQEGPASVTPPSNHVGVEASFNENDVLLSLAYHHILPFGEGLSMPIAFSFRPYGMKTLVRESQFVYLRLRETRYSLLVGVEKQFAVTSRISPFIQFQCGLSVTDYAGSNRGETGILFPVLTTGFQFSFPEGRYFSGDVGTLRTGYQYLDIPANRHRLYLSFLFAL